jgi:hypothetical protein
MQIYDIDKEKVLAFRKQITKDLLSHRKNRRNPNYRFVDEDITHDHEECEVIVTSDAATHGTDQETYVDERTEGRDQEDRTHEVEEPEVTLTSDATTRGTDQETYTDERMEGAGLEGPSAEQTLSEEQQLDHHPLNNPSGYTDERTDGAGLEGPSAEQTLSEEQQLDHHPLNNPSGENIAERRADDVMAGSKTKKPSKAKNTGCQEEG